MMREQGGRRAEDGDRWIGPRGARAKDGDSWIGPRAAEYERDVSRK